MIKIKKIVSFLLSIIFLILLIIFVAGLLIPLDIKKPTKKILKQALLDSVSIENAKLHLPDDFKFKNLNISNRLNKTNTLFLEIPKLQGDTRFFYILQNREKILTNLKGKFKWNFIKDKDYHMPFIYSEFSGQDTILVPVIEKAKIKNGRIFVDSSAVKIMSLKDIDCDFISDKTNLPSFKINLFSKSGNFYHIRTSNLSSEFSVNKSLLYSSEISFKAAEGNIKVKDFSIDMAKNVLNSSKVSGKKLNIEKLYPLKNGKVTGLLDFKANMDTSFFSLSHFKAKGKVTIKDFNAKNIPLLRKIVKLTDIKSLEKVSFNKLEAEFYSSEGKIHSDTINAAGKDFSLSGSGYFKPENQYFYYDVIGVFEPHMKDSMSTLVWDALLPMKDGKKYFKCLIEGTPNNPSVHLKREMVKSAAKSLFKSIKNDFKSLFN